MKQFKSYAMVVTFLLLSSLNACASSSEVNPENATFKFIELNTIEPEMLWHSSSRTNFSSNSGMAISYWEFADEEVQQTEDYYELGFIMIGMGDLGEKPISFKLLSKKRLHIKTSMNDYVFEHENLGVKLRFCLVNDSKCTLTDVSVEFLINPSTLDIKADGLTIGSLRNLMP